MGYAPRALLAGVLGLGTSFLVACGGGSGLLSADQANSLNSKLDQVSSAIEAGQCDAAANEISAFSQAVNDLPGSVSATLTRNLEQGASTVARLASKECFQNGTTSAATTTSTPTSTSTTSTFTPTTTSSSSTTTSTSTTTTSTPTTTTQTTTSTSTATTPTGSGTTSTGGGSGGAGLGGGGNGAGATGGAGTSGSGNGNAQ